MCTSLLENFNDHYDFSSCSEYILYCYVHENGVECYELEVLSLGVKLTRCDDCQLSGIENHHENKSSEKLFEVGRHTLNLGGAISRDGDPNQIKSWKWAEHRHSLLLRIAQSVISHYWSCCYTFSDMMGSIHRKCIKNKLFLKLILSDALL